MAINRDVWHQYRVVHRPVGSAFIFVIAHFSQNKTEHKIFSHLFIIDFDLCRRQNSSFTVSAHHTFIWSVDQ